MIVGHMVSRCKNSDMSLLVDAVNRWKNNNDEIEDDRLRICLIVAYPVDAYTH